MNQAFALTVRIAGTAIWMLLLALSLNGCEDAGAHLPIDVRADRIRLKAERLLSEKDYQGALKAMEDLIQLHKKRNLSLPDSMQLKYAHAALAAGKFECAKNALKCYLKKAGRTGDHYAEALKSLDDVARAKPEMVGIPPGCLRTERDSGKDSEANETPSSCVSVDTFEISKHEVTFEQYDRFVAATGYGLPGDCGWGRGRRPVIRVTCADAVAYTRWLSWVTGDCYSLPTEVQWLYAACAESTKCRGRKEDRSENSPCAHISKRRAGSQACVGDLNPEGYRGPGKAEKTAPVGSFEANPCGLYDMYGNVSEWVLDCPNDSRKCEAVIGTFQESGDCSRHIARGGSWKSGPSLCRTEKLTGISNEEKSSEIGFRVVRKVKAELKKKKPASDSKKNGATQSKASKPN